MKIAYIVSGSGDSFYCQNCLRDREVIFALKSAGHDVVTVPLYLPLLLEKEEKKSSDPVFYPAVNLFLKQNYAWAKRLPSLIKKWLDSKTILKMAASMAGSTRATGLEDLTISMLKGEDGKQKQELENLCAWLSIEIKPDVIQLANALLIGLASKLKQECKCPVVCSLQDEHTWMDSMQPKAALAVWELMKEKAADIDLFMPVTKYYEDFISEKLGLTAKKLAIMPVSVHHDVLPKRKEPSVWSIGYLSRMEEAGGLDDLLNSIRLLKLKYSGKKVMLYIDGGFTTDDKAFIKKLGHLIRKYGLKENVVRWKAFDKAGREEFFSRIDVMTVPKKEPEALGLYLLESLSCGVPVVLPDFANFAELLGSIGAGLMYRHSDPADLTAVLENALLDPKWLEDAGKKGLQYIADKYSPKSCAQELTKLYLRSGAKGIK